MKTLLVERVGGVTTVTLNRPERKNAINAAMWDELKACFRSLVTDQVTRAVVVTGAKGEFCSGADLSELGGVPGLAYMRHVSEVALALHQVPQPVIAKVVGVAAGYGANLALGCDLVVASDDARFSEIFARRGLSLDGGGSWTLPRLVGLHRAKEIALFGELLSAADARELGLVNRVVPRDDIDKLVEEWAARLASGPTQALSLSKRLLNDSAGRSMAEALEAESMAQTVNFASEDTREALLAFAEKRDPRFGGR